MIKKISALLLMLVGLFQVLYGSGFVAVLAKPRLSSTDYTTFSNETKSLALLAGLALLLAVSFLFGTQSTEQKNPQTKFWWLSFGVILLFSSATVLYTNPGGRFPWNKRSEYLSMEARTRKLDFYKKLAHTPDVILFGSSVTFFAPADYFQEKWGLRAFNLALNGGGPVDFVNMLNVVKRISPDAQMPSVVMVELLNPSLKLENSDQTPLEYIPDMATFDQIRIALSATIKDILNASQFSDSLFTLFFVDRDRWTNWSRLSNDGTLVRLKNTISDKDYNNAVKKETGLLNYLQSCEALDAKGKTAVETLVNSSRQEKFGIIFYRTPINADFYRISGGKPARYAQCAKLLNDFLQEIVKQNPNVFYRNLSQYQRVATGGKAYYLDTHHLIKPAYILVLDALSKDIEAASQWAKTNRTTP